MPLKRCSKDGQEGWKWGDEGHCYIGPNAKENALKQGKAIEISKNRKLEDLVKDLKDGKLDQFFD